MHTRIAKIASLYVVKVPRIGAWDSSSLMTFGMQTEPLLTEMASRFTMSRSVKVLGKLVTHYWKTALRDLVEDLKAFVWWQALLKVLVFVWLAGILSLICVLPFLVATPDSACMPNGAFSLQPEMYNTWTLSGFFQVTLGFGNLSFGTAKFIDTVWDVVVGRGGQAILTFISYRVLTKYFTATMMVSPISFGTYKTVFIQSDPSLRSTLRLIREFTTYRALRSKVVMIWIGLSAIFILASPTMTSAMTAYTANVDAFVHDRSNSMIPFSELRSVIYIVHDGERVHIENERAILVPNIFTNSLAVFCDSFPTTNDTDSTCFLPQEVSNYTHNYGFFGLETNITNSTFVNQDLQGPILNISGFYGGYPFYGMSWLDPRTGLYPMMDVSTSMFSASNETYDFDYVMKNGSCQATNTYKWGFSFLILFLFLVLLLLWTIGMLIMWTTAHFILRFHGHNEVAGSYKAVLELATAIQKELSEENQVAGCLTEKELEVQIKGLQGGMIPYDTRFAQSEIRLREIFFKWCRRTPKMWKIAFSAIFIVCLCINLNDSTPVFFRIFFIVLSIGLFIALALSRTRGSKWVITLIFVLLGVILGSIFQGIDDPVDIYEY